MGLCVFGCKNIKLESLINMDDLEDGGFIEVYIGQFKEQGGDLINNGIYSYTDESNPCSIGYGGYSHFRECLAEIGGHKKFIVEKPRYTDSNYENLDYFYRFPHIASLYNNGKDVCDGPFVEVILFSDCEGVICSSVCSKLYVDFKEHKPKAKEYFADNERFYNFYIGMMEAFKYGAENGLVQFG